jgi:hypothetical protein
MADEASDFLTPELRARIQLGARIDERRGIRDE